MWKAILYIGIAFCALPKDALPQSRIADGAVTIERALTISTVRALSFGRVPANGATVPASGSTDAIIQVTGDPGRLYRVRLPAAISTSTPGITVDSFTIWSDNSGDISNTLTARMDGSGQDRLRIGGSLRRSSTLVITDVTTAIPLSVDYE